MISWQQIDHIGQSAFEILIQQDRCFCVLSVVVVVVVVI